MVGAKLVKAAEFVLSAQLLKHFLNAKCQLLASVVAVRAALWNNPN